ncbi:MAG: MarR family transcriptional regulator [Pseudomonadota bacterium]|nr:MarR family transcriptional regulator [Pseudomonadota bacterium]
MNDQDIFDENLDRSIGFLLNDVARLMRNRFDRQARDLGLTRAQWRVMMFLRRHEGARQTELAGLLEVENVTLGRHIDRLEESGWVERRPDPSDRRAWRLFLDKKSQPILDKLAVVLIETRETALSGFNNEERDELIETLFRIKSNLVNADAVNTFEGIVPPAALGASN